MKVEERQGKYLFVAESDDENNAVAALVSLLTNTKCKVTADEANDHGCGFNDGKERNYVYIPTVSQLDGIDT